MKVQLVNNTLLLLCLILINCALNNQNSHKIEFPVVLSVPHKVSFNNQNSVSDQKREILVTTKRNNHYIFSSKAIFFDVNAHKIKMQLIESFGDTERFLEPYSKGNKEYQIGSPNKTVSTSQKADQKRLYFKSIIYRSIFKGIDLQFETNKNQDDLKSSFFLQQAKLLNKIKIQYQSDSLKLEINSKGKLEWSDVNNVIQMKESVPVLFQNNKQFSGQYYFDSNKNICIKIEKTTPQVGENGNGIEENKPLIVDPNYSTYLGSSEDDSGHVVWNDRQDSTYVGGNTQGSDFPVTIGSYSNTYLGLRDGYLLKTLDGKSLIWCSFIGSDLDDYVYGLRTDSDDNPVITGTTHNYQGDLRFPTTDGAYLTNCDLSFYGPFLTKFQEDGSDLIWSTYACFGETGEGIGLDIDDVDNNYVVGNFENNIGRCEPPGNSAKIDIFILKLSSDGKTGINQICMGGTEDDTPIWYGNRPITVNENAIYLTGSTSSSNYVPDIGTYQVVFSGEINCYITRLNQEDLSFVWSTYFGQTKNTRCTSVDVNSQGEIWVTGYTDDPELPTTDGAYQMEFSGKPDYHDAFFIKFTEDGVNLLYSSYLGNYDEDNRGYGIRVDLNDQILVSGNGNPFNSYNFNYNYGRGSYVAFFDASGSKLLKKITIGARNLYGIDLFTDIFHFSVTGDSIANSDFYTTEDVFQPHYIGGDRDAILVNLNMNCDVGEYGTNEGCELCPAGTYNNEFSVENIKNCLNCQPGSYSEIGASQCSQCESGTYGPIESLTACFECPAGSWSDAKGADKSTVCTECVKGTYSNTTGSSSINNCLNCPQGTYSIVLGSSSKSNCLFCPQGTYNPKKGSRSVGDCIKCPNGTYNPDSGSVSIDNCIACPAGTYSIIEGITSESSCTLCPEGTFNSDNGGSTIGVCESCPVGHVSSGLGATICRMCQEGEQPGESKDFCIKCPAGSFSDEPGLENCKKCTAGTFNDENGQTTCTKCSQPGVCLGGNECSEGRDMEYVCTRCVKGYFLINSKCEKCPKGYKFYLVIGLTAFFLFLLFLNRRKIARFAKSTRNPMKGIIFTFLQFFAALLSLTFDWPNLLSGQLRIISSVFTLQVGVFAAPECYYDFDFFKRWLMMFLIPIFFTFVLFLTLIFHYAKYRSDPDRLERRVPKFLRWYTMFLKWIYLPYLLVSFEPFQFSYQNAVDNYTLDADPSITLDSAKYRTWLPYFICSVLIYVLGIPIILLIILIKAKKANFNEYYENRYGWMFRYYKPNRYWFEIEELLFKLFVMVTTLFFNFHSKSQAWTVITLFLLIIFIHLLLRPYKLENKTSFLAPEDKASIGFFTLLLAMVSLSIRYLYPVVFLILYPIAFILIYHGLKDNWAWFKQSRKEMIREFDQEEMERKERELERKRAKKMQKINKKRSKSNSNINEKKPSNLSKLSIENPDQINLEYISNHGDGTGSQSEKSSVLQSQSDSYSQNPNSSSVDTELDDLALTPLTKRNRKGNNI
ncbi:hypothetical protein M0813_01229 [Anaeramoeba flamelloides]|uniref:Tyrosine-protein kinase ephrin type A/B receptor-like domain-containing protein n=1 Tax=Anaeramoeba flamelloides TaxID=1746091 RepID=A0ABQ8ZBW9_9EUKA|nr:hypothetical protein M0813_01229 [Anaeramoeba flamelloides]